MSRHEKELARGSPPRGKGRRLSSLPHTGLCWPFSCEDQARSAREGAPANVGTQPCPTPGVVGWKRDIRIAIAGPCVNLAIGLVSAFIVLTRFPEAGLWYMGASESALAGFARI